MVIGVSNSVLQDVNEELERHTMSFLMLRAIPDAVPRKVTNRPNDWNAM